MSYYTILHMDFWWFLYLCLSVQPPPTRTYQDRPGPTTHQVPLPAAAHSEQLDRGVTLNVVSAATPAPNEIQRALVSGTQKDN
jgi:hypothetical protein